MPSPIVKEWLEVVVLLSVGLYCILDRRRAATDAFHFWRSHRTANLKGYQQLYVVVGALFVLGSVYKAFRMLWP